MFTKKITGDIAQYWFVPTFITDSPSELYLQCRDFRYLCYKRKYSILVLTLNSFLKITLFAIKDRIKNK